MDALFFLPRLFSSVDESFWILSMPLFPFFSSFFFLDRDAGYSVPVESVGMGLERRSRSLVYARTLLFLYSCNDFCCVLVYVYLSNSGRDDFFSRLWIVHGGRLTGEGEICDTNNPIAHRTGKKKRFSKKIERLGQALDLKDVSRTVGDYRCKCAVRRLLSISERVRFHTRDGGYRTVAERNLSIDCRARHCNQCIERYKCGC